MAELYADLKVYLFRDPVHREAICNEEADSPRKNFSPEAPYSLKAWEMQRISYESRSSRRLKLSTMPSGMTLMSRWYNPIALFCCGVGTKHWKLSSIGLAFWLTALKVQPAIFPSFRERTYGYISLWESSLFMYICAMVPLDAIFTPYDKQRTNFLLTQACHPQG